MSQKSKNIANHEKYEKTINIENVWIFIVFPMKKFWSTFGQHMLPKLVLEVFSRNPKNELVREKMGYKDNQTKVIAAKLFGRRYIYIVLKNLLGVDQSVD